MASFETRGTSTRAIVRTPGGKKLTATFDTKAQAEAWAAAREAELRRATPAAAANMDRTNAEVFETYLDTVASKTDSAKWNRLRLLKWCSQPIGKMRAAVTTTHDVNEWISARLQERTRMTKQPVSPGTVLREINLMSAAFQYAVAKLRWLDVNPCHGAERPAAPPPRDRPPLTAQDIQAIRLATGYDRDPELRTLTARVGACFLLALETGMRSGEILRLRPADYDRDARVVSVRALERGGRKTSRSGRNRISSARQVPLTGRAVELLDQLLRTMPADQKPVDGMAMPPYLAGLRDDQRDALWRKAVRQAGVHDLHYHDTKHEACTKLSKHLDVIALSVAIGTKDIKLLRDTYYQKDAQAAARLLPQSLMAA